MAERTCIYLRNTLGNPNRTRELHLGHLDSRSRSISHDMNWNVMLSFYICLIAFAGRTKFPIFDRRMWFTSLLSFFAVHFPAIFEEVMELLK